MPTTDAAIAADFRLLLRDMGITAKEWNAMRQQPPSQHFSKVLRTHTTRLRELVATVPEDEEQFTVLLHDMTRDADDWGEKTATRQPPQIFGRRLAGYVARLRDVVDAIVPPEPVVEAAADAPNVRRGI